MSMTVLPAGAESGPWTVIIPDYTPPLLNKYSRSHWSVQRRMVKGCADLARYYAILAGVRIGRRVKRRLGIEVFGWPKGSLPDPDNVLKVLLDGLTQAGVVVDDGQNWCEWDRPKVTRSADRMTVVVVEDVPESAVAGAV